MKDQELEVIDTPLVEDSTESQPKVSTQQKIKNLKAQYTHNQETIAYFQMMNTKLEGAYDILKALLEENGEVEEIDEVVKN